MVLWIFTACYMVTPEGGQQGEDLDDTGMLSGDSSAHGDDTDALVDSDAPTWVGTVNLEVDDDGDGVFDRVCSGEFGLNDEGSGEATCTFETEGDPQEWDLTLVGTRVDDTLNGTIEQGGSYEGTYVAGELTGTLQGEHELGGSFTGSFSATEQ